MEIYRVRRPVTALILVFCAFAMYLLLHKSRHIMVENWNAFFTLPEEHMAGIQTESTAVVSYGQAELNSYNSGWSVENDEGFIHYIRHKWLHAPPGAKVNLPVKDYSQFGEKAAIDKLIQHKRNGFFFEVGALDGMKYSNTLNLELELNWTGILVEPDPTSYKKLLNLKRNVYSMNACLSPNKSAILPFYSNMAISTLVDNNRYQANNKKKIIDVQCFPLYSILLALGKVKIDFFSLDIEGAEEDVLESLPMDKVDIRLFLIEYLHDDLTIRQQRLQRMKRFFEKVGGYKFVGTHKKIDAIFQKV